MNISLNKFIHQGVYLGDYFEDGLVYLFFGNKNFTEKHCSLFTGIDFQFLKQTHSDVIVDIRNKTSPLPEADAQVTQQRKLALAIQTADCLPILAYDDDHRWIAAIHAGWRGIENRIAKKTLIQLEEKFNFINANVFIGPHIQQNSFEVNKDVAQIFETLYHTTDGEITFNPYNKKYYLDLQKILKMQLEPFKIKRFYPSAVDTFVDSNYSSYRREKTSCRNWSFIYLL